MEDEVRIQVLKRGIKPPGIATSLPLPPRPPLNVSLLCAPLGSHVDPDYQFGPSRDCRNLVFEDDWVFFANHYWQALRIELTTLDHSAWQTSITLSLDRPGMKRKEWD